MLLPGPAELLLFDLVVPLDEGVGIDGHLLRGRCEARRLGRYGAGRLGGRGVVRLSGRLVGR
ncbi:hypothetical protein GCM10010497_22170 [Streptomyces cinereoruber]|uniref:Uncharacterized protein n=1 Tax=Streptomyces cinereoruber TaxID=67260 RepID=A0AAV4KKT8_9ACTN|nr:hypothetical protein GCM10010497_22170 [Streptomyces cinereoruber]